ncbi:hypothetical protein SUNI508_06082 [Seiridium unicorne]|uniref:EthD domain-containing protein n=1 Tax=Seiridium unicorne TaxID=138068 RepID=A0ABR2V2U7_9PEZI
MSAKPSPDRLLRYTLSVYRSNKSSVDESADFARQYLEKVAPLHAKNGIEMYQQSNWTVRAFRLRDLDPTYHLLTIWRKAYTPVSYRTALEEMNRRDGRGFVVDVSSPALDHQVILLRRLTIDMKDHDVTVEFYFRSFAELHKVTSDPEFQAAQATEGPYVNLVHTVVSLGWVEKYIYGGKVVNIGEDGKSTYPPWSELNDLSTAFPAKSEGSSKWSVPAEKKEGV